MMGILVSETCWGNKTSYFFACSWFFTVTDYIVVLIFVLSPDGSISTSKDINILQVIWAYESSLMMYIRRNMLEL
jgi:hypothetical protein